MGKKRKVSKKKIKKFIILIIGITIAGIFIYSFINKNDNKSRQITKTIDKLEGYGYSLNDNETAYYQGLFNELKKVLKETSVDEEKYATLVGQLFLADFYNLDNKINKNDIGGIQFVYKDYQDEFTLKAKNTVYHYVENNIYGKRKQKLPIVTKVEAINVVKQNHSYLDKEDDKAFKIDYRINYKSDLGYAKECTLILIHNNNKLEIVKMN